MTLRSVSWWDERYAALSVCVGAYFAVRLAQLLVRSPAGKYGLLLTADFHDAVSAAVYGNNVHMLTALKLLRCEAFQLVAPGKVYYIINVLPAAERKIARLISAHGIAQNTQPIDVDMLS